MLTRAKSRLIVIGNHETLSTDPNWKAFIEMCEKKGALIQEKKHPRIEAPL